MGELMKALLYVGTRPLGGIWDWHLRANNLRFLKSFDSHHFEYLARLHAQGLKSKRATRRQQAATALRTSYGLGLETLFALLGAALQAPDCVFAWLDQYRIDDLSEVIGGISGRKPFRTVFRGALGWNSISAGIHSRLVLADKAQEEAIKEDFATLWSRLAADLVDPDARHDYNSVKHGLRIQPGGFRIAVGRQDEPDTPAPPERMRWLGAGSEYGSSVFSLERIGTLRLDYSVRMKSRNWDPLALAGRLRLISMSVNNIVSCLQIVNGEDPRTVRFIWPKNLEEFVTVWRAIDGPYASSMGATFDARQIEPTTLEEIEAAYSDRPESA